MSIDAPDMADLMSQAPDPLRNGHETAAPAAPRGPRIPRIEEWVTLPEPYQDFKMLVWVNYPQRLLTDLRSVEDVLRAGQQVLLAHNGWQDDDGELPPPHERAFWDRLPEHLLMAAWAVIRNTAQTPPNLPPPTRRRS